MDLSSDITTVVRQEGCFLQDGCNGLQMPN